MGYQMRTIQKINKTRSGSGRAVYIPLLTRTTKEINLKPIYIVRIGWVNYRTGKYKWFRELSFVSRDLAEKARDQYFDNQWIHIPNKAMINTVAIIKQYKGGVTNGLHAENKS